ncbi:restriction endonuclease subunit S [Acinetobacter pseudolwoffii]|uniref:restriction endonuclease subunit S n=1 Tax=Acinetobacter pseudolwoffii TaxID=2053287 RepID=UPI001CE08D21|nr:restriction endonuclease subunit S [Acinetobacter pseudolwoffii]UBX53243.1 restriction endonuclease subunit S [Acinetobacter pseudolwoffii]
MIWELINLGDLTQIRTGKLDANASSTDGEYPFFTCAKEPLKISSYTYDCECVLVAGNGDLNVKYYDGKFDAYQRTYIIESKNKDLLNVRYLFHFLDKYLVTLREQSIGGIIKYIKLGNLTDAKIPLPPIEEQRRIAAILDKADELRQKRQQAIEKLDQLLQATFIDMFGDPITNPKGWEVFKSKALFQDPPRIGTTTPANGEGIPVVRVGELGQFSISFDKCGKVQISETDFKKFELKLGDLVLARAIGSKNQLGKCSYFSGYSEPVCIDSHVMRLRPDSKKMHPLWFYFLLSSDQGKKILQSKGGATAVQFNINSAQANDLDIALPPLNEQTKFVEIANKILKNKEIYIKALEANTLLFSALQNQAFSGNL